MRVRLLLPVLFLVLIFSLPVTAAARKISTSRRGRAHPQRYRLPRISRDPYLGAIIVDAKSGRVLFSDHADAVGYPASVVKLMDLLIIMEKVHQGTIKLGDIVTVTAEAAMMGGSQAYLKQNETFTVNKLLYALMLQSANDAAVALAIHVAGSKDAFVQLMNRKARELGMTATHFHSVHGLPPGRGQLPDVSTPRDLVRLARAVLRYPEVLRYTATKHSTFRHGTFDLDNHNPLLGVVKGCDGLKTGYFAKAGFSIIVTARHNNQRVIAVILGSRNRATRNRKAREFLAKGFQLLSASGEAINSRHRPTL